MKAMDNLLAPKMPVDEYRDTVFVGNKAPSVRTVKRWIDKGELPGVKIGSQYFVLIDQADQNTANSTVQRLLS